MIRTEKTHLISKAITHEGMSGKNNEDRYGVSAYTLEDKAQTPVLLAVLSDGIGGHRAGEVASEMVVDLITKKVEQSDGSNIPATLEEAIHYASQEVNAMAQADAGRKGMGATVSIACIVGNRLYTATVGDSRIYLMRAGNIYQISTDHTWIQEALESGILTPEQAVGHPNAHIIRRYVGAATPPEVDFRIRLGDNLTNEQMIARQGMELQPGDRLLLCSDGLTDLVNEKEIFSVVMQNPPDTAVKTLVDMANERGGHDNITVILLQVPGTPAVKAKKSGFPTRSLLLGCAGLLVLAAVIAVVIFGYLNRQFLTSLLRRPTATATITETVEIILPSSTMTIPATNTLEPTITYTPRPTVTQTQGITQTADTSIQPPPSSGAMSPVPTDTSTGRTISFSADIQPIFSSRCSGCHGTSGGLSLGSYAQVMAGGNSGTVVQPGNAEQSLLYQRITGVKLPLMPPSGSLPAEQIELIYQWITQGALNN